MDTATYNNIERSYFMWLLLLLHYLKTQISTTVLDKTPVLGEGLKSFYL
jgi:hypothetical protein